MVPGILMSLLLPELNARHCGSARRGLQQQSLRLVLSVELICGPVAGFRV